MPDYTGHFSPKMNNSYSFKSFYILKNIPYNCNTTATKKLKDFVVQRDLYLNFNKAMELPIYDQAIVWC